MRAHRTPAHRGAESLRDVEQIARAIVETGLPAQIVVFASLA